MRLDDQTLKDVLASIAAKTPTPGGGAAAAITAALAASLAQMVLNYSVGKNSLSKHDQQHRESLAKTQTSSTRALELAEHDALAYAAMNEVWKLDAADPRRARDLPGAVLKAIEPPRNLLTEMRNLLRTLHGLVGTTNAHLNSDLAIAAVLADSAARAAAWNVQINLPMVADLQSRRAIAAEVNERIAETKSLCDTIERSCRVGE